MGPCMHVQPSYKICAGDKYDNRGITGVVMYIVDGFRFKVAVQKL